MKYIINILASFFLLSGLLSCKKYLDIVPDNVATLEYAFRNKNEAENYLFSCYNRMQSTHRLDRNAGWSTSGELIMRDYLIGNHFGNQGNYHWGFYVTRGNLSPYGSDASTNILNDFGDIYVAIRRCNIFLENVHLPPDLPLDLRERWVAEVKALKAYYYFYLLRKYGPVPLVKENLPISAETDEVRIPRAPSDEVFAYINLLLNEAVPYLPEQIYDVTNELGRFTKIMALSLKAKAAVLRASPLFNGDPEFSKLKNKDGTFLFPTTYDESKWTAAAAACKEAIALCEANSIYLFRYEHPANLGYFPDSLATLLSIHGPVNFERSTSFIIPEVIWPGNVRSPQQVFFAPLVSNDARAKRNLNTDATLAVPIAQAEIFYSNKGVPIEEDITYDYVNRYGYSNGTADQKFYIRENYPTANLNQYREPRYYADLAFDGGVWYGMGRTTINNLLFQNAVSGNQSNYTGYWPKKLVNHQTLFTPDNYSGQVSYYPPVMRLTDLYLLYAEALNEASGPGPEVYRYIDSVRARAGLKGVVESWSNYSSSPGKPLTKEGLRSIIHQERMIELCFEGEIGWDLRRWKKYLAALSKPFQGWNYVGTTTTDDYYKVVNLFTPNVSTKNYFWPLHESLILNNSKLVQNLYW